jgi:small conductance mechanosensitive channel
VLGEANLVEACGDDPRRLCRWLAEQTWGSEAVASAADWLIDLPVRVIVIFAVGWLVRRYAQRSIRKLGDRLSERNEREEILAERRRLAGHEVPETDGRASLRTRTITSVLSSIVSLVVWVAVALLILDEFGLSLAPLLAGAGVVGIMLAFGAQTIVADFLAGFFMLIEDQFGVGDVVDLGEVTGTVEKVTLRVTSLRDVNGAVWHVPNSEVRRVVNKSQLWSRAVLDIEVAYDTDLRRAEGIIQRVADDLWRDHDFDGGDIIDPPEVWGVERLGADGVALRLVVKTDPAEQWAVARELRLRIKEALDEAGIEIPFPQRTIWLRQDDVLAQSDRPQVAVAPIRPPAVTEEMVENPNG